MPTSLRIGVVTRDGGPVEPINKILEAAEAAGHHVAGIFATAPERITRKKSDKNPIAYKRWEGLDRRVVRVPEVADIEFVKDRLLGYETNILLVAAGFPVDIERVCMEAARKLGIPIVVIEDVYGALSRLKGLPADHALILDNSFARDAHVAKTIVGHPTLAANTVGSFSSEEVRAAHDFIQAQRQKNGDIVLLLGGQGPGTTEDMFEALLNRADQPGFDRLVLIDARHGGFMNNPIWPTWQDYVDKLKAKGLRIVDKPKVERTDLLAIVADGIWTAFSTMATVAASMGKMVFLVEGSRTTPIIEQETGFTRWPLADGKGVPVPVVVEDGAPQLLDLIRQAEFVRHNAPKGLKDLDPGYVVDTLVTVRRHYSEGATARL